MQKLNRLLVSLSTLVLFAGGCGDEPTATASGSAQDPATVHLTNIDATDAGGLVERWRIETPSGVTGTPVTIDQTTWFADWDGIVRSVDLATGDENWRTELPAAVSASPAIADGVLYVMDLAAVLHALDTTDGTRLWAAPLDAQPGATGFSSPAIAGDKILVGISGGPESFVRGSIVAVDASTGGEVWRTWTDTGSPNQGGQVSVWSTAVIDQERQLAFIGTGNTNNTVMTDTGSSESALGNSVLALDLADGDIVWSYRFVEKDRGRDFDVGAKPNLFAIDGREVVGVGAKAGDYAVLDRDTGDVIWRVELTTGSAIGGVMGVADVADDSVLVASNIMGAGMRSELFSVEATTGAIRWQTGLDGLNIAGATVANGVVYVGTSGTHPDQGTIYAIDAADGSILWSHEPGTRVGSRVVPAGDDLILAGTGFGGVGGGFSGVDDGALIAFAPA
jgi:polyvinyl alcohol dehydrogenase (cytochrome)